MCQLADFNHLKLCQDHRTTLNQELPLWHRTYPQGSSILHAGAGCGETVQFYINHGSKFVLAVEGNPSCYANLKNNFRDDPRVLAVNMRIDGIEMDIEGAEKNAVIEIHFPFKMKRLARIAGQTSLYRLEEDWGSLPHKAVRKLLHANPF
jgi:hypothetical protein